MATTNVVNLDALLPREDLSAPASGDGDIRGIKISELEAGVTYALLRKPDFQRETANWSPAQVADLIETAVRGDIIPAIILWDSGRYTYVIDGAHRLSALIAWVRDDYGAGTLSTQHYKGMIPERQRTMHAETQRLVNAKVGSYQETKNAGMYPDNSPEQLARQASRISFREIDAQWIRNATIEQARAAFFRINQGGVKIEQTELRILRSGNSPVAIASRAITRAGVGHQYWSKLEDENARDAVPKLGEEIYKLLFDPPLKTPIRTLEIPMAGLGYGAHVLPFVFEVVNTANRLQDRRNTDVAEPDTVGQATHLMLKKTRRAIELLCSNKPPSLGLHPALYFYTSGGEFHPAALNNAMEWFMDLEDTGKIRSFLKVRREFEGLLLSHPSMAKPATNMLGSGRRTRPRTKDLFSEILASLLSGKTGEATWGEITAKDKFAYLLSDDAGERLEATLGVPGAPFTRGAKSAAYFAQTLPTAQKCALCGGLIHMNGIVDDHAEPRSAGGSSASENGRWVHPRCNSEREYSEREARANA